MHFAIKSAFFFVIKICSYALVNKDVDYSTKDSKHCKGGDDAKHRKRFKSAAIKPAKAFRNQERDSR